MASCYGFRLLQGKSGGEGFIRIQDTQLSIQLKNLLPGTSLTLYRDNTPLETKSTSSAGVLSFCCHRDGFFFLCDECNRLLFWEQGDDSAQSYCRALALMQRKQPTQPLQPPAPAVAAPPPPTPVNLPSPPIHLALSGISEEAEETSPAPLPMTDIPEVSPPTVPLRPRSHKPPAFTLPIVQWPESIRHLQALFHSGTPCHLFPAPGYRCFRLPSPHPALPYCIMGYLVRNSRVTHLIYALPGHPAIPPRGFTAAQYRDGHFIRTQSVLQIK